MSSEICFSDCSVLNVTTCEELAQPISWQEEDAETTSKTIELLATPHRRERNISPTFLVATALVELHESPTRVSSDNQELPLNLTKKS